MSQTIIEMPDQVPSPGRWRYPVLFGLQTLGAAIFVYNAVPHYRHVLADPAGHEAQAETLVWSLSAIVLIQLGYWIRFRAHTPLPEFTNALLGHSVQFIGRMGFVLATSVFGFVFITQKPGFHMPAFRYVVTLVVLFSVFCYQHELDDLGKALSRRENRQDRPKI